MDTMHISMENGKPGKGASQCRYVMREGQYNKASMRKELAYSQQYNMPAWAQGLAGKFFAQADKYDKGNPYKSFIITLPKELPLEENIKIVDKIIKTCIGEHKPVAYAIHIKKSSFEGVDHPHAHIMFSTRDIPQQDIDNNTVKTPELFFKRANHYYPERGGYPKDTLFVGNRKPQKEKLKEIRQNIIDIINNAYKENGIDRKFTCKSLKTQREEALQAGDILLAEKLDRKFIERNLGPKLSSVLKKVKQSFEQENPGEPLRLSDLAQKILEFPLNGNNETVANSRYKLIMALNAKFEKHKKEIEYENALKLINQQKEYQNIRKYDTTIITAAELKKACKDIKEIITAEIKNNSAVIKNIDRVLVPKQKLKELLIEQITHGWSTILIKESTKIKQDFIDLKKRQPNMSQEQHLQEKEKINERKNKLIEKISVLNQQLIKPETQTKLKTMLDNNIKYQEQQENTKTMLENRNETLTEVLAKLQDIINNAQQSITLKEEKQQFQQLVTTITEFKPLSDTSLPDTIKMQKQLIDDIQKFLNTAKNIISEKQKTDIPQKTTDRQDKNNDTDIE